MDLTTTTTTIPNNTTTVKTPEPDTETPTRVKLTPFTNGVLKRHAPPLHHPIVVTYKECLRNHAAALGTHAVDGCGEFMPSLAACNQAPADLKCAACGCHRNFHRREPENIPPQPLAIEYQPHHRHHPPPPPSESPNNSPSPPPISSAYYPSSAPHMLLALSHSMSAPPAEGAVGPTAVTAFVPGFGSAGRKRFRTRFTQEQKEKMSDLAERVGWKMLKRDEDVISEFCNGIGVGKGVFKVWMHNNKHHFGKHKDGYSPSPVGINTSATTTTTTVIGAMTGNGYLEEIKPNFHHGQEMNHQNLIGNGNSNGTQIQFQGFVGANGNGTTQSSSC